MAAPTILTLDTARAAIMPAPVTARRNFSNTCDQDWRFRFRLSTDALEGGA
jgi:hypothetical protein